MPTPEGCELDEDPSPVVGGARCDEDRQRDQREHGETDHRHAARQADGDADRDGHDADRDRHPRAQSEVLLTEHRRDERCDRRDRRGREQERRVETVVPRTRRGRPRVRGTARRRPTAATANRSAVDPLAEQSVCEAKVTAARVTPSAVSRSMRSGVASSTTAHTAARTSAGIRIHQNGSPRADVLGAHPPSRCARPRTSRRPRRRARVGGPAAPTPPRRPRPAGRRREALGVVQQRELLEVTDAGHRQPAAMSTAVATTAPIQAGRVDDARSNSAQVTTARAQPTTTPVGTAAFHCSAALRTH